MPLRCNGLAAAFLPQTDDITGGVTNGCNPQISFGVRSFDNLATVLHDPFHNLIDAIDIFTLCPLP
jgi:hypothetical protein